MLKSFFFCRHWRSWKFWINWIKKIKSHSQNFSLRLWSRGVFRLWQFIKNSSTTIFDLNCFDDFFLPRLTVSLAFLLKHCSKVSKTLLRNQMFIILLPPIICKHETGSFSKWKKNQLFFFACELIKSRGGSRCRLKQDENRK